MRGKLYESEYEEALIDLLQDEGWQYTNGGNIHRQLREPLLIEDPNVNDLHVYLQHRYPDLTSSDVNEVVNYLRHVPGQTHFERLRNTFQLVRDGYRYTRHGDGVNFDIRFIDFESPDCKKYNIFRAVNQFEVAYGMKDDVRIPDVLLFVNGIPLCIFELKNPTKLDADIAEAYNRYTSVTCVIFLICCVIARCRASAMPPTTIHGLVLPTLHTNIIMRGRR